MSQTTKIWLHGLSAAAIGGAVSSLTAVCAFPDKISFDLSLLKVAGVGAFISVLAYFKQSPLPDPNCKPVDPSCK